MPAVVPDIANDLQYCDGLRAVTLKVDGYADVVLSQVIDEPPTWKEMEASNGQVRQGDTKFIWSTSASSMPPLGARMVDDQGIAWVILSVEYKDQVQTYEALCRNLSIVNGLDNKATVLRATYTHGRGNDAVPHWHKELEDIPARFQPSAEAAQIFLGAEFTKTTYRVIFAYPVPIELAGGEYRLVDAQGHRYRVMEYIDEQRIDTLPVAIAVRILEGNETAGSGSSGSMSRGSGSGSGMPSGNGSGSGSNSGSVSGSGSASGMSGSSSDSEGG